MNRVWTTLILLATVVVAGAVGYVLVHNDKVVNAGKTPGFSVPASSPTSGTTPTTSGSGATSTSTSSDPSETRIAFLGDNWANGAGVRHDSHKSFPYMVARGLSVQYTVVAEDGSGYAKRGPSGKTYGLLASKVVNAKPDIVVVTGGRNDVSDAADTLRNDAKSLFSTLKSQLPDATLVAVAPFWGDSDHPGDLSKVDDAVESAVESAGGTYLDLPDPLHDHEDWMADPANPSQRGNQAIADALVPELKKLLD